MIGKRSINITQPSKFSMDSWALCNRLKANNLFSSFSLYKSWFTIDFLDFPKCQYQKFGNYTLIIYELEWTWEIVCSAMIKQSFLENSAFFMEFQLLWVCVITSCHFMHVTLCIQENY